MNLGMWLQCLLNLKNINGRYNKNCLKYPVTFQQKCNALLISDEHYLANIPLIHRDVCFALHRIARMAGRHNDNAVCSCVHPAMCPVCTPYGTARYFIRSVPCTSYSSLYVCSIQYMVTSLCNVHSLYLYGRQYQYLHITLQHSACDGSLLHRVSSVSFSIGLYSGTPIPALVPARCPPDARPDPARPPPAPARPCSTLLDFLDKCPGLTVRWCHPVFTVALSRCHTFRCHASNTRRHPVAASPLSCRCRS